MAQDPLSRVASWITPASADVTDKPPPTSRAVDDPVLALIAEEKRLDALAIAADERGDEIFKTLPEDIRKRSVRVSFSAWAALLDGSFTSEADLNRWVHVHRRLVTVWARIDAEAGRIGAEDLAAEEAEFDREIGLDQALAQLRGGLEEIKAIREASGCEAHYSEARDLEAQVEAIFDQLCQTKPITLGGAIAMLQHGYSESAPLDSATLIDSVVEGLRDLQAKGGEG